MRRFRQRIIVFCALALSVLTVLTVFLCTYFGNKLDKLQKRAERAELELSGYRSEKVQIVCASENIKAGEALCEENLMIREFPAGFIPDNTILDISEAVGCTAKIQLFKNTYLHLLNLKKSFFSNYNKSSSPSLTSTFSVVVCV